MQEHIIIQKIDGIGKTYLQKILLEFYQDKKCDVEIGNFLKKINLKKNIIYHVNARQFSEIKKQEIENYLLFCLKNKRKVYFHIILVGGNNLLPSLEGLHQLTILLQNFTNFIIWLNPCYGELLYEGKQFTETKLFKKNEAIFQKIIELSIKGNIFDKKLFENLVKKQISFKEAIMKKEIFIIDKQRIMNFKRNIFSKIQKNILV